MTTLRRLLTTKLHNKLLLALVLLLVLIMAVAGGYWLNQQQALISGQLHGRANQTATLLSNTLGIPLWNLDQNAIYDQLDAVMADPALYSATVYEEDNTTLRASRKRTDPAIDPFTITEPIIYSQGNSSQTIGSIELVYTRQYLYEALAETQRTIFIVFLTLAVVIAFSTYILLQYIVIRPLGQIATLTQRIASGDYATRIHIPSQDEIGQLAASANQMAAQLQDSIDTLELRVAERTRDLKITADVSRQVTTVLDLGQLLREVTQATEKAFDLYYVSVFLYDDSTETIFLAEGSDAYGNRLATQEIRFPLEQRPSLVAKAARERRPVVVNDVSEESAYAPSDFFPLTRSETNLPMLVGDSLVGVLGLQAAEVNRFTPHDVDTFRILAEQIGVAVRNAQLYQQQLQLAEELRIADMAKSSFLASMTHELRTPLNAIINFTEMVALGMIGPIGEEQSSLLNQALASSRHLLNLINDLLDISKIEAGKLSLLMSPDVDLLQETQTVLHIVEPFLHDRPVELVVALPTAVPLLTGDKRRIRQILLNLLSNGIKFTEEGTIRLEIKVEEAGVLISVADSGPGIAPEMLATIFEPFIQTADGIKQAEGTGLGLPIAKSLAEAHGGRLWVESEHGRGATFYVYLPYQQTT
jgi:signal transduction histidine kinase/HAMP domain-containing protein